MYFYLACVAMSSGEAFLALALSGLHIALVANGTFSMASTFYLNEMQ